MPWIPSLKWRQVQYDLREDREEVWRLHSVVIDLSIDNENLRRKIAEYDEFLAALHKVRAGAGA